MSLASEDDHVRLTLEVAPGGEAVRVVLMSKPVSYTHLTLPTKA